MHGDHVATCLCCRHLDNSYEGDLSDVTPGDGFRWECLKNHFSSVGGRNYIDDEELHDAFTRGAECPDFEGRTPPPPPPPPTHTDLRAGVLVWED